jgi:uncharacterized LabA/DUF88 family protein
MANNEHCHAFVDGAYLRRRADAVGAPWPDPRGISKQALANCWRGHEDHRLHPASVVLTRVTYYDARPSQGGAVAANGVDDYWKKIESLDDARLGFGELQGTGRNLRQKAVDTLLAVHMLAGAFTHIYSIAVLVAGDADFVPVVEEVSRQGVMVIVAAEPKSLSKRLRSAADRVVELMPHANPKQGGWPPLQDGTATWPRGENRGV